jgi:hypothetical protein
MRVRHLPYLSVAACVVDVVLAIAMGRALPVDYTTRSWWSVEPADSIAVRSPTLVGAALALVSQWSAVLGDAYCSRLLAWCVAVARTHESGAVLAFGGVVGGILQFYARPLSLPASAAGDDVAGSASAAVERVPLWSALSVLHGAASTAAPHPLAPSLLDLLCVVARHGVAPCELFLWARLLLLPDGADGVTAGGGDDGDAVKTVPLGTLVSDEARNPLLSSLARVSSMGGMVQGDAFASAAVLRFDLALARDDAAAAFALVRFPSLMPLDAARLMQPDAGTAAAAGDAYCLWPPSSAYSVSTWLRVDRYDAVSPLHVLRLLSSKGRVEVNLVITAGIVTLTCCGKSAEFATAFVHPGRWYHIVVIHQIARIGVRIRCCVVLRQSMP